MTTYPLACLLPPRSLAAVVAAYPEVMAGLARDDERAPAPVVPVDWDALRRWQRLMTARPEGPRKRVA